MKERRKETEALIAIVVIFAWKTLSRKRILWREN